MDGWQLALLAVSGYMAVVTLIRLMQKHRDRLYAQLEAELERQRAERKAKKKAEREAAKQARGQRTPRAA